MAGDTEIKKRGLNVLFKELGEADAIRFLSQISYEKRDYLKFQEKIFKGMTVEDIYKKAQEYFLKEKNKEDVRE
jgi:hypothetical protein